MLLVLTLPVCYCALLKLNLLYMYFFKNYYYYPCVAPIFSFKWDKELINNNNHHNHSSNHSNSHNSKMVITRKPLT